MDDGVGLPGAAGVARLVERIAGETPRAQRRPLALSGGWLFAAGATLVLVGLLVERTPGTRLVIALPALAVGYGVALVLLAAPELLPVSVFPYLTAGATVLISVVAYADGTPRSAFVLLYMWAALYAFYWYSLGVAILETVWISTAVAVEILLRAGQPWSFSMWLLVTGSCLVGGLVIRHLLTEVRVQATRDPMTGLYNRRSLEEQLQRDQQRAARAGRPLSVLMLDIDNLKEVNDRHGHAEGDRCIREVARTWNAELRRGDVIARYGGDEFIVVMLECTLDRAREVADRLRSLAPQGITTSAGAAQWDGTSGAATLIACADSALYRAKLGGRNRTAIATVVLQPTSTGRA